MVAKSGRRKTTLPQQSSSDADQAEIRAILDGFASITSSTQDEQILGIARDEGEAMKLPVPDWETEQVGLSELSGDALRVVEMRASQLDALYPFKLDRSALIYDPKPSGLYEYFLATSEAAAYAQKALRKLLRHFERVALDSLIRFAGDSAVGVRLGWPSERDAGFLSDSPKADINKKVDWMKRVCKFDDDEWVFYPSAKIETVRRRAKDARIDGVIRRPIYDSRSGGLTILLQCGCGKHDVDEGSRKHTELNAKWLNHFFGQTTVPQPVLVFATSQHVVNEAELFTKQSESDNIIVDRLRLVKMVASYPDISLKHSTYCQELTDRLLAVKKRR